MKILVVCQYYYPEPFRINVICEKLAARGHEVAVVTGEPNYPEGEIYPGYEGHSRADELLNGVRVHRCPIAPRKKGAFRRAVNYYSFVRKAKAYINSGKCRAQDGSDFDIVFIYQLSPVIMADPALTYKKKHSVPAALYCLDLWPESLIAGGVKRSSPIFAHYRRSSKRIYRSVDKLFVTSRFFRNYMTEEFGISSERVTYLPQYAEEIFSDVAPKAEGETVTLVFAGNIGAVQSIDTLLAAAEKLKAEPVRFIIVGGGSELERIEREANAKNLGSVEFAGRRPLEEMPKYYSMADAMLITLNADPFLSRTLPGKMQSYMASGRPIIGAIDGEAADVIRAADCGFVGRAEDADELAGNIMRFVKSPRKAEMGRNSRKYYEENFEESRFIEKLESELAGLVGKSQ